MSQDFREFEKEGWEEVASGYHRFFQNVTPQTAKGLLELAGVKTGEKLLDVATGPGYLANLAHEKGAQVLGVDHSEAQVAIARSNYPHLQFQVADAEHLPFADASFDHVCMNFLLMHLTDAPQALREARRVLKKGGQLSFSVWASPKECIPMALVMETVQKYGKPVNLPPGPDFFFYSNPKEVERALVPLGFSDIQTVRHEQSWPFDKPDDLFIAFGEGAVRMGALLRGQTPEDLKIIRAEIAAAVQTFGKMAPYRLPMPALLNRARV